MLLGQKGVSIATQHTLVSVVLVSKGTRREGKRQGIGIQRNVSLINLLIGAIIEQMLGN